MRKGNHLERKEGRNGREGKKRKKKKREREALFWKSGSKNHQEIDVIGWRKP